MAKNPLKKKFDTWIARNPLRQWRTEQKLTQVAVGSMLGINYHKVFLFEKGSQMPTKDEFKLLSRVMKRKTIKEDWEVWINGRYKF